MVKICLQPMKQRNALCIGQHSFQKPQLVNPFSVRKLFGNEFDDLFFIFSNADSIFRLVFYKKFIIASQIAVVKNS